jgi:CubicO group peptidase (beta-lactamase class C family)
MLKRRWLAAGLLALLALFVAACGGADRPASPSLSPTAPVATETAVPPEKIAALRAVFSAIGADEPGCSAAVGEDGKVVWAEGFGLANVETGAPITPETVFDIASTSKQFTATAILLLAQEGKLDLDAPVRRYLPQLASWADRVTLRQMMHHESGIPEFIGLLEARGLSISTPTTQEDAIAALEAVQDLNFEPGTQFAYTNSNYILLSQVVEAVTGRTLTAYLRDTIFEPLGLKAVMDPVAAILGKAAPYALQDGKWVSDAVPWAQTGFSGVQTTPSELVRWAAQYWDPTIGGAQLLAARSEGAVPYPFTDWLYGAGIFIEPTDSGGMLFEHPGDWGGYVAQLLILPEERLAVAVSCNRIDSVDSTDLARRVMAAWREK